MWCHSNNARVDVIKCRVVLTNCGVVITGPIDKYPALGDIEYHVIDHGIRLAH